MLLWCFQFSAVISLSCFSQVQGQFDPLLNVESCTKSRLVVSTYGATDGGIIYIQGQGENCKQPTQSGMAIYEFDFSQCGIEWEMLFKMVIQKNSGYQTGADKQIPIFCIPDRSDIIVDNSKETLDKADDMSLNLTVRPSAFMSFYKVVSDEEVSGTEVKLTDTLMMILQLDEQWTADFDIKARYCVASDIVIIDNFCSTDQDLFPNFYRLRPGYLMSEFGAFRATDLDGGAVLMNFSCVLQVCKDECEVTPCNDGTEGWGRKKRDITLDNSVGEISAYADKRELDYHMIKERQADESGPFDIDVGGKVKIVEKYSDIQIVTMETLCLNVAVLIVVLIFLSTGVIGFASASVIFYRKWRMAQDSGRKEEIKKHPRQFNTVVQPPQLIKHYSENYANNNMEYDY